MPPDLTLLFSGLIQSIHRTSSEKHSILLEISPAVRRRRSCSLIRCSYKREKRKVCRAGRLTSNRTENITMSKRTRVGYKGAQQSKTKQQKAFELVRAERLVPGEEQQQRNALKEELFESAHSNTSIAVVTRS